MCSYRRRAEKTDKRGACQVVSNTLGVFSFSSSLRTRGLGMWLARGQKTGLKVQSMPQTHWDVLSLLMDMRSSIFWRWKRTNVLARGQPCFQLFFWLFPSLPPLFSANVDLVSDQCTRHSGKRWAYKARGSTSLHFVFPPSSARGCASDLMAVRGFLRSGLWAQGLVYDERHFEDSINDVPPARPEYSERGLHEVQFPCTFSLCCMSSGICTPTRRLQRVRLFLSSCVLYMPWIPGKRRRGIWAVNCVAAHLRGF